MNERIRELLDELDECKDHLFCLAGYNAFSCKHTQLESYEQQDFRCVIKVVEVNMLVTGTDDHDSE